MSNKDKKGKGTWRMFYTILTILTRSKEMKEKEIMLNEEKLNKRDFQKKKKELEKKAGVKVVQISENKFKTQIQG